MVQSQPEDKSTKQSLEATHNQWQGKCLLSLEIEHPPLE